MNERHYGALQGLNKAETAKQFGEQQVFLWRRSYDVRPPLLTKDDERYPGKEAKYRDISEDEIPLGECLKDTVTRFLPYWHDTIAPTIESGKKVLIAAHGNSLRALVKYLDNMTDEAIVKLNIPTGIPLVYELDENLHPIKNYYLGDTAAVQQAMEAVAKQGKTEELATKNIYEKDFMGLIWTLKICTCWNHIKSAICLIVCQKRNSLRFFGQIHH